MTTDTLNNTPTNNSADADRHNSKMAKKKVARDKKSWQQRPRHGG